MIWLSSLLRLFGGRFPDDTVGSLWGCIFLVLRLGLAVILLTFFCIRGRVLIISFWDSTVKKKGWHCFHILKNLVHPSDRSTKWFGIRVSFVPEYSGYIHSEGYSWLPLWWWHIATQFSTMLPHHDVQASPPVGGTHYRHRQQWLGHSVPEPPLTSLGTWSTRESNDRPRLLNGHEENCTWCVIFLTWPVKEIIRKYTPNDIQLCQPSQVSIIGLFHLIVS